MFLVQKSNVTTAKNPPCWTIVPGYHFHRNHCTAWEWRFHRIVITGDRCDYDDLSELANYPEHGKMIGIFYFAYPHELGVLVKAFEGLFYQLFAVDSDIRIGSGVLDDNVFDDINNW